MRKLRNVLEEVEEIFDETRTLGPDDVRLLEKAGKASDILYQLDLAVQSYSCSEYIDVNEGAIADFKTVLDVTAHEVFLAFEAINTGTHEDAQCSFLNFKPSQNHLTIHHFFQAHPCVSDAC